MKRKLITVTVSAVEQRDQVLAPPSDLTWRQEFIVTPIERVDPEDHRHALLEQVDDAISRAVAGFPAEEKPVEVVSG